MSDNIPIEIQMEIVKRVPVKSLYQFRSVSKSWKSLIDSSQFIADYNACESRPQHLLIKYTGYRLGFDTSYVCIVDDDIFPQNKFEFATSVSIGASFEHPHELNLVGSSQGLLCLLGKYEHDDDDDGSYTGIAFIWNPAIRKSIAIDVGVSHEANPNILGFGVCPNTNEPMLVMITHKDIPCNVEVFTLSSRVWRSPRRNLPRKSLGFKQSQVAIGDFIYWQTDNRLIVSFDMASEEFTEINLPQSLASTINLSISKLRESLVVLEHYRDGKKQACTVWMMEHNVPKSFTKLFKFSKPCLMNVLGFRKNGEVMLEVKIDYYGAAVLEVYEPHSKHIKRLGIYGDGCSFWMSSYKETLLLLDQVDNQHIDIKMEGQRL